MPTAATIAGGISLIVVAGVCNGSWNASFSPKANLAVSTTAPINDITHHHSYALFQIYAVIINIPLCIVWAGGGPRVSAILAQTAPSSIALVLVFSILWGIGTLLFGLACKIAGVGLGTNLSIGVVAVIGTILPLITEGTLVSPAGAVICSGVAVCCAGLWLSTRALKGRDEDEITLQRNIENKYHVPDEDRDTTSGAQLGITVDSNNDTLSPNKSFEEDEKDNDEPICADDQITKHVSEEPNKSKKSHLTEQKGENNIKYATWQKVGICVATGIFAVQLQFAFIFGQEITDLALGDHAESSSLPGSTPESGGAAIIWLLAISLGAPPSIINGIYASPVPLSSAIRTPFSRHLKIILTTSLPWLAHIHIYGVVATTLLPERVAASIGWPMLMMITTAQALILSVYLGEWKAASKNTLRILKFSLVLTVFGLGVLMSSVALPTS